MTADHALPAPHLDVLVQGRGSALLLAHGAGGGIEENFGLVLDDLAQDHTLVGPHCHRAVWLHHVRGFLAALPATSA